MTTSLFIKLHLVVGAGFEAREIGDVAGHGIWTLIKSISAQRAVKRYEHALDERDAIQALVDSLEDNKKTSPALNL